MIDFELSDGMKNMQTMTHMLAEQAMRPISREYDEKEHEKPWDFLNMMWGVSKGASMTGGTDEQAAKEKDANQKKAASERTLSMCVTVEELCWGDVGLYLSIPNPALPPPIPSSRLIFQLRRLREVGAPTWRGASASSLRSS